MVHFGNVLAIDADTSMSKYFTGRVELRKMVSEQNSKEIELFLVSFFDGARTKIHYHETDQVLLATEGSGTVALQSSVEKIEDSAARVEFGDTKSMKDGDFVFIPAGVWHWHGAQAGCDFAHLQSKRPGKTVWLEK